MKSFSALTLALICATASSAAFVTSPNISGKAPAQKSALAFGFLKELGLEKPDWLPDFGGAKKKEEAATAEAAAPEEEASAEKEAAPAE